MNRAGRFKNLAEGVSAIMDDENFGFLVESTEADQLINDMCGELVKIGHGIGDRHFSIAFPHGSPYRDVISNQILTYHESGLLLKLKEKWFKQTCNPQSLKRDDEKMILVDFRKKFVIYSIPIGKTEVFCFTLAAGPFFLLLIAGLASLTLAFKEVLVYAYLTAKKSRKGSVLNRRSFGSIVKTQLQKIAMFENDSGNGLHSSSSTSPANEINGD